MSTADTADEYSNNKKTAAEINALPRDGSEPLIGRLTFKKTENGYGTLQKNHSASLDYGIYLSDYGFDSEGNEKSVIMRLCAATRQFLVSFDGDGSAYYKDVLHTGNKPSGAYTGNGSDTEAVTRAVDIGGIGNALMVYYPSGFAIVGYSGAIYAEDTTITCDKKAIFRNGVLTIAGASCKLNVNQVGYTYQVL